MSRFSDDFQFPIQRNEAVSIPVRNLTDGDEHEVEDGDGARQHVAGLVEDAPARGQRPTASYAF